MLQAARATRQRQRDLARLLFHQRRELGKGLHAQAGAHDKQLRVHHSLGYPLQVLHRVVGQLARLQRVQRQRIAAQQQGVAIATRMRDRRIANAAAGAGLVLDHHALAPFFAELLRDGARQLVAAAACRHRHHDLDGPVRIAVGVFARHRRRPRKVAEQARAHDDAGQQAQARTPG
ncbi:hypothetical protein D3C87_1367980 [compost metagenome]